MPAASVTWQIDRRKPNLLYLRKEFHENLVRSGRDSRFVEQSLTPDNFMHQPEKG